MWRSCGERVHVTSAVRTAGRGTISRSRSSRRDGARGPYVLQVWPPGHLTHRTSRRPRALQVSRAALRPRQTCRIPRREQLRFATAHIDSLVGREVPMARPSSMQIKPIPLCLLVLACWEAHRKASSQVSARPDFRERATQHKRATGRVKPPVGPSRLRRVVARA